VKKSSLLIGIGGILLLTGCCCRSVNNGCVNDMCNEPSSSVMPIEEVATKQPTTSAKPLIEKVEYENKTCYIKNGYKKSCILKLEGNGVGVAPCNDTCSMAQAKVMARRAAVVDAYRALAEKMYGIKINGRDTVKNMILQNSELRTYISGLIRGANIVEEDFKDGIYTVTMEVTIDPVKWNKYLENN